MRVLPVLAQSHMDARCYEKSFFHKGRRAGIVPCCEFTGSLPLELFSFHCLTVKKRAHKFHVAILWVKKGVSISNQSEEKVDSCKSNISLTVLEQFTDSRILAFDKVLPSE